MMQRSWMSACVAGAGAVRIDRRPDRGAAAPCRDRRRRLLNARFLAMGVAYAPLGHGAGCAAPRGPGDRRASWALQIAVAAASDRTTDPRRHESRKVTPLAAGTV